MFDRNFGKERSTKSGAESNIELMTIDIVKSTNYDVKYVKAMPILDFIKLYKIISVKKT